MKNIARSRFLKIVGTLGFLCGCLLFVCSGCLCPLIVPDPPPKEEAWPSWSPDGQRLTYECYLDGPIQGGSRSILNLGEAEGVFQSFYAPEAADICISDFDGHNQVRLTKDPGGDWHPVWSPDGSQIAYLRQDGIYLITTDGQNRRQLLPLDTSPIELGWRSPEEDVDLAWSPDGDRLLFSGCLNNSDRDVYVVDVDTAVVTNLTPNSRMHDISPMWTLNGTKVVFLSTASSSSPHNSCFLENDAPHLLKVINADGSGESVVYDKEFYYAFVSVSNGGQIAFVANMTSTTAYDYSLPSTKNGSLYRIDVVNGKLTEMLTVEDDENLVVLPEWSPDEESVAYTSFLELKILEVRTGEVLEPLEQPSIDNFVWSPDSQKIAANTSTWEDMAVNAENHIYIFDIQSQTFSPLVQEQSSP